MRHFNQIKTKRTGYYIVHRTVAILFLVAAVFVFLLARVDTLTAEERKNARNDALSIEGSAGVIASVVDMLERGEIKDVFSIYHVRLLQRDENFVYRIRYRKGIVFKEQYYFGDGTVITEEMYETVESVSQYKRRWANLNIQYLELTILLEEAQKQWH